MTKWLNGPKSPGLMILEHELDNDTVQAFEDAYPLMVETGWKIESAARINGTGVYLNSEDSDSPVDAVDGVLVQETYSIPPSSSTLVSTPANPTSTGSVDGNTGSNTSQSGNNASMQSAVSKFAGVFGAIFLTVVFYAW